MWVSRTLVICQPYCDERSRYTCGSREASITIASSFAPMRYERHPFPVRRTWMTRTSFAGTGTSAVFQARLQAFMPPSRDSACNPRACSCEAAIWLVLPAAHTVTTGPSLGASTLVSAAGLCARRASYAFTWILPGMAHSAHSAVGRTSRIVTGRLSSNHTLKVSTSMVVMRVLLFRFRLGAPALANLEALVRVGVRCTRWSAAGQPLHRQTHNRDHDSMPRFPCLEEALGDEPPVRSPE